MELTEELLVEAIQAGIAEDITHTSDVAVPLTLFDAAQLAALLAAAAPQYTPFIDKEHSRKGPGNGASLQPSDATVDPVTGVVQRRLDNGVRVNIKQSSHESQRGQMRIVVPGGRQLERHFGHGAVAVGARTMQEGGAFGSWAREQVELFCIDHLVMVTVDANEEFLIMELSFPTTKLHAR
jgi:hypothetical protein